MGVFDGAKDAGHTAADGGNTSWQRDFVQDIDYKPGTPQIAGDANAKAAVGSAGDPTADFLKSTTQLGFFRDEAVQRQVAEKLVNVYDQKGPSAADEAFRKARGESNWNTIPLDSAKMMYDRVIELSQPSGNSKVGWDKYNKMTDAVAAGMKEPLTDAASRSRAIEKFSDAMVINPRMGEDMVRYGRHQMEELSLTTFGKNARTVRDEGLVVGQVRLEGNRGFPDAMQTLKTVDQHIALAHKALSENKLLPIEGVSQAARHIARALTVSPVATQARLRSDIIHERPLGQAYELLRKPPIRG